MRCCLFSIGVLTVSIAAAGCVERTLQIDSEPQGALVYLNGQEAGRTPMRKSFIWYGTYDVVLRKEGYETLTTKEKVWAPLWQAPPFDLVADLVPAPLVDKHRVSYVLEPVTEESVDPNELAARGLRMREQLRGSRERETRAQQEAVLSGEEAAGE